MKSQDIFLLLKLISLEANADDTAGVAKTVRSIAALTGVGKSEVNAALNRCIDVRLAKRNNAGGVISVNRKGLFEFIVYGLKYVFPAQPAELTRGLPTAFAAPALSRQLFSAGEIIPVWPDPLADKMGQAVSPLYHSVPFATKTDKKLYAYLALVDAIRIGGAREQRIASNELHNQWKL